MHVSDHCFERPLSLLGSVHWRKPPLTLWTQFLPQVNKRSPERWRIHQTNQNITMNLLKETKIGGLSDLRILTIFTRMPEPQPTCLGTRSLWHFKSQMRVRGFYEQGKEQSCMKWKNLGHITLVLSQIYQWRTSSRRFLVMTMVSWAVTHELVIADCLSLKPRGARYKRMAS